MRFSLCGRRRMMARTACVAAGDAASRSGVHQQDQGDAAWPIDSSWGGAAVLTSGTWLVPRFCAGGLPLCL